MMQRGLTLTKTVGEDHSETRIGKLTFARVTKNASRAYIAPWNLPSRVPSEIKSRMFLKYQLQQRVVNEHEKRT